MSRQRKLKCQDSSEVNVMTVQRLMLWLQKLVSRSCSQFSQQATTQSLGKSMPQGMLEQTSMGYSPFTIIIIITFYHCTTAANTSVKALLPSLHNNSYPIFRTFLVPSDLGENLHVVLHFHNHNNRHVLLLYYAAAAIKTSVKASLPCLTPDYFAEAAKGESVSLLLGFASAGYQTWQNSVNIPGLLTIASGTGQRRKVKTL